MKKSPLFLSLLLFAMMAGTAAISIAILHYCRSIRNSSEMTVEDRGFVDLDSAIRAERLDDDWTIHRKPGIPGPYRVVGAMHVVGRKSERDGTMYLRANGSVVAISEIRSAADFDQMGLFVQSENGHYDSVVLKRTRIVPVR